MKKNFGFMMVVAVLVVVLSSSGSVFACTVEGDFNTPGSYACAAGDLWTLLGDTGGGIFVPTLPSPLPAYTLQTKFENYAEGDLLLITGRNGFRALYSVGEVNPSYGPTDAVTITLDKKGLYDLAGKGRAVEDVADIDLVHAVNVVKGQSLHFHSTRLVVSGEGIVPQTYDLANLQEMDQVTYTDTATTPNTVITGPTLLSVLKASGVDTMDMNSYVVVSATDAYATVLSMYEVTHETGTQYDMLAISASDGSINGTTSSDNGFARLVLPGDNSGAQGRWVSNADEIVVYKLWPKVTCLCPPMAK